MGRWWRRIRGLVGNSVSWGLAWFAGSTTILGAMLTLGFLPRSAWSWEIVLEWTTRIGMAGLGAGALFSSALPMLFRSGSLREMGTVRFILGGAVLGAVTFLAALRLTVGPGTMYPSEWFFAAVAAAFGAGTAGTTLLMARHAERLEEAAALQELESAQSEVAGLLNREAV